MLHWGNIHFSFFFWYLLGPICVYSMLIFYYCLPMLCWRNIYSFHASGPVFSTIPAKQEELILIHFKLVLVEH